MGLTAPMETMKNRVLLSGNETAGEAAVNAGCCFYAGYPITPQNQLTEYMSRRLPGVGGTFIQAESEVAAINMVFGASSVGERAMTSSSSPGISLKQEGISYLAGAQLPAVIVNVMRGGPGLGNIAPSQSDYFQATRGGGHGDYHSLVFAPSSVQEAYDLMYPAFNLADKYRIPAIILADAMLGQMMEPLKIQNSKLKIKNYKKPWALTGCKGREPNLIRSLYLAEGALEEINLILQKKYKIIQQKEARYEARFLNDAKIILVAYGTLARITQSAAEKLRNKAKRVGLIRPITLWPFPKNIFKRLAVSHKRIIFLVIEMSYGQMLEDVRLAVEGKARVEFLGRAGGEIPTEEEIVNRIKRLYG